MRKTIKDIEVLDTIEVPVLENKYQVESLNSLGMNFWDAFHNSSLRSEFKMYNESREDSKYYATIKFESMIRYIALKDSTVYKRKLKNCETVADFTAVLLEVFDRFNTYYSLSYKDVPYTMFSFLDFILEKEFVAAETIEEVAESKQSGIRKMRKIAITFPDGNNVTKKPADAMEAFVNYVGVETVSERNYKLVSEPFLTKNPSSDHANYYRNIEQGWYMNTCGDTLAKYRLLGFLNESLNAGLKIKLL